MELLTERHADEIAGVLSCYDRILIQGTLPGLCYAEGMTRNAVELACREAHQASRIPKPITPHSMRHYSASRTITR